MNVSTLTERQQIDTAHAVLFADMCELLSGGVDPAVVLGVLINHCAYILAARPPEQRARDVLELNATLARRVNDCVQAVADQRKPH